MRYGIGSAVCAAVALLAASCGEQTHTLDEARVDELRLIFEKGCCEDAMEDLAYEISVIYPYLEPDSLPADVIPAEIPDSLTRCPVSDLVYQIRFEASGMTVECPSGHGSIRVDY